MTMRASPTLGRIVIAAMAVISFSLIAGAQTSYSIAFANQTSCDIKASVSIDQIGNGCAAPSILASWTCTLGTTTTCAFTVPSGYELCAWKFVQIPYTGGPYVTVPIGSSCTWNFSNQDLCNSGTLVSGKGNCTSARFSQ